MAGKLSPWPTPYPKYTSAQDGLLFKVSNEMGKPGVATHGIFREKCIQNFLQARLQITDLDHGHPALYTYVIRYHVPCIQIKEMKNKTVRQHFGWLLLLCIIFNVMPIPIYICMCMVNTHMLVCSYNVHWFMKLLFRGGGIISNCSFDLVPTCMKQACFLFMSNASLNWVSPVN